MGLKNNSKPNKSVFTHSIYAWARPQNHKNAYTLVRLFFKLQVQLVFPIIHGYLRLHHTTSLFIRDSYQYFHLTITALICSTIRTEGGSLAAPERLLPLLGASGMTNVTTCIWALITHLQSWTRLQNKAHLLCTLIKTLDAKNHPAVAAFLSKAHHRAKSWCGPALLGSSRSKAPAAQQPQSSQPPQKQKACRLYSFCLRMAILAFIGRSREKRS